MTELKEALSRVSYPGRGIVLGLHENGIQAAMLYFIMGRSENSRNRVFAEDGDGIRTKAYDESKMKDPSLIIYHPVRVHGNNTVVTNGDQTDTVFEELKKENAVTFYDSVHAFDTALRTREYEPDEPNFTPRISGIVHAEGGKAAYALNILKADTSSVACGDTFPSRGRQIPCLRFTFEYAEPVAGCGHFIHTYDGDGNPLPSFTGEPECVKITGDLDSLANEAWEALDTDNKVSLFVRLVDLATGKVESKIFNKNP